MKKQFFVSVCLCCFLFGCTYNPQISNSVEVNTVQFNAISGLAYIGGSVVYNPTNPAVAQLNTGSIIAVHHGKVKQENVTAKVYQDRVEDNAINSDWAYENITSTSVDKESNIYGYMKIGGISKDKISFEYHLFTKEGRKTTKNFSLNEGDSTDINNDGNPDIKYTPLLPIRSDFEGAMCLEFISNYEKGYTTMYAPTNEETLARTARTVDEYDNTIFYGINSNGSFIYISGEEDSESYSRAAFDQSNVVGVSHGDYIINSESGEIFAVVGNVPENDSDEDSSESENDLSLKNSEEYIELDDGELQAFFTYLYRINQFADEENGPQALLRVLPKELLPSDIDIDIDTCSAEEAIDVLFHILTQGSIVEILVEANGDTLSEEDIEYSEYVLDEYIHAIFPEDVYQEIKDNWNDPDKIQEIVNKNWDNIDTAGKENEVKSAYLNMVAMNRHCIERYYKESPRAAVLVPDISSVYPMMSLNISEVPTELDDFSASRSSFIPESQLNDDYKDFLNKKQKIDYEFGKFYSLSLSSIKVKDLKDDSTPTTDEKDVSNEKPEKGKDKEEDKGKEFSPDTFRSEIKIGITGSFETRSGHIESSLASAVYASFDGNFREFSKSMNIYKKKLFDEDTTFMIGPVPITIGLAGNIGIDVEAQFLTNVNYAIEFVGMYGAGADLEVNYGFRRKFNPFSFYVDPSFNTFVINRTEFYAGPVTKDNPSGNASGGHIILKPSIVVSPSLKLGPKYTYVGVSVPLGLKFNGGLGLYNPSSSLDDKWFVLKENIFDDYNMYGKLGLGASIGVKPVIGIKIPIIGKRFETNFGSISLAKAEYYFDKDRNFRVTGSYIGQE